MSEIELEIGDRTFTASLLRDEAPESVERVERLLPLETTVKHVRWSGYAVFVEDPGGDDVDLTDLPRENAFVHPSRGDVLLYPGYENVPELLVACGSTAFASPVGELAGNHVATIDASRSALSDLEVDVLENGAREITIREA
jgi:hypothetical protein